LQNSAVATGLGSDSDASQAVTADLDGDGRREVLVPGSGGYWHRPPATRFKPIAVGGQRFYEQAKRRPWARIIRRVLPVLTGPKASPSGKMVFSSRPCGIVRKPEQLLHESRLQGLPWHRFAHLACPPLWRY
jgi:hypothetical protein